MTTEDSQAELEKIIEGLKGLEPKLEDTPMLGRRLPSVDTATFKRLVLDAVSVIKSELNPMSDHFSFHISGHTLGSMGPNEGDLQEVSGFVQAAINQLVRVRTKPPVSVVGVMTAKPPYVGLSRIAALRAAPQTKWDTRRLVRMLEELNDAHERGGYLTVAMLLRAIKDHVPPVFDQRNFAGVVANHSPGSSDARSWKALTGKLEESMKHIADTYLHQQIRKKELVPDEPGVDFKASLDILIGETERLLR